MEKFVANIKENIYGYARVSTQHQKEDRQIEALKEFGIDEENIFVDKRSGKDFEREEYQLLKKIIKRTQNNVLVIKSIDRLGRNYKQIKEEWREITQDLKTDIVSFRKMCLINIYLCLSKFCQTEKNMIL